MTVDDFVACWPRLRRQVRGLEVPWIDAMSRRDRDPFRVLVSCILSLRTQDKVTAEASRKLFLTASTPAALAAMPEAAIAQAIYPVGFYRVKARQLRELGRVIAGTYGGMVPDTVDELLKLKGVGRKTANLVVTVGHDKPGICVDTHVHRITNRWGLIRTKNPDQTEAELRRVLPRRYWKQLNSQLVAFGQNVCKPLSPFCSRCSIAGACRRVGVARSR